MEAIKRFIKGEEGVTAIEYALIAAGIAIAIAATVILVGAQIDAKFKEVLDCLKDGTCPQAAPPAGGGDAG
jgi:pilus assembly protein Flp/PilA